MGQVVIPGLGTNDGVVFPAAETGSYYGTCVKAELTETGEKSKHPGSPMLKTSYRLEGEGSNDALVDHYIVLPNHEYMDATQMERKVSEIKALQITLGVADGTDTLDTEAMLNRRAEITVVKEMGNNGYVNSVKNLKPVE